MTSPVFRKRLLSMDKKTIMESLARKACEKDSFNGAWLYAENGVIVSKGTCGWRDPEGIIPPRGSAG